MTMREELLQIIFCCYNCLDCHEKSFSNLSYILVLPVEKKFYKFKDKAWEFVTFFKNVINVWEKFPFPLNWVTWLISQLKNSNHMLTQSLCHSDCSKQSNIYEVRLCGSTQCQFLPSCSTRNLWKEQNLPGGKNNSQWFGCGKIKSK